MRKTILIGAALALFASGPVMANGAAAIAAQQAAASNEGVSLTNTFEASKPADSLKTVPDVNAPVINAAPETCGIPVAGGAAWMGFGFTAGTAYTDQECVDRLNARQFVQMGMALGGKNDPHGRLVIVAGVELMCEGKKQAALKRAGIKCGVQEEDAPAAEKLAVTVSDDTVADANDPFAFQTWE